MGAINQPSMNTQGFDAEQAAAINRTIGRMKTLGKWGLIVGAAVAAACAIYTTVNEEEEKLKLAQTPRDDDSGDDGPDDGGEEGATNSAAETDTPGVVAVDANVVVPTASTPGADDTPEPEGPGKWVTAMMALLDGDYGPDVNDEQAMQDTQLQLMMNELQSLQEVLTGKKKNELIQLVQQVQENEGNPMYFQMLQQYAAEAGQELSPEEQMQRQQVFFGLQLQASQAKLQQKILEITKQLVFDALEQEDKAAGEALQESMNVVEQECKALEQAGKGEESARKGAEFSVEFFTNLAAIEAKVVGDKKTKLRKEKNETVYNENMKFARFQIETEVATQKQQQLMEIAQADEALMMFIFEKQQAMMTEQDPQQRQMMAMMLPQDLEIEVCRKKKRKAKFEKWVKAATEERQMFWRDRMLEQQLAYERNELRVELMDAAQRKALREQQVESQLKAMQNQMQQMTQAELDRDLDKGLDEDKRLELDETCLQRKRELELMFLPASECGNAAVRNMHDKAAEITAVHMAKITEYKNDPKSDPDGSKAAAEMEKMIAALAAANK